jgi:leucyl aminopeptidase
VRHGANGQTLNTLQRHPRAGAGTGAWFIGAFISRDIPWAHLDIAGVAYGPANAVKPAGSAGYGVRLLDRLARDWGR